MKKLILLAAAMLIGGSVLMPLCEGAPVPVPQQQVAAP